HFMGTSTFSEYTVMPEIALAKVDSEASLEAACLFACGLSTGLGAAMVTAQVQSGSTCVVFGAGLVGLGAVAGCRLQGAERIISVDLSDERLGLARRQGATDCWRADGQVVERVLDQTGGLGADYTFEATGLVAVMREAVGGAAPARASAWRAAPRRGYRRRMCRLAPSAPARGVAAALPRRGLAAIGLLAAGLGRVGALRGERAGVGWRDDARARAGAA